jgi:hypothetical protein
MCRFASGQTQHTLENHRGAKQREQKASQSAKLLNLQGEEETCVIHQVLRCKRPINGSVRTYTYTQTETDENDTTFEVVVMVRGRGKVTTKDMANVVKAAVSMGEEQDYVATKVAMESQEDDQATTLSLPYHQAEEGIDDGGQETDVR